MKELGGSSPESFSIKKEKQLEPTLGQKRAAGVDFFIKRVNIFNKGSESYTYWKKKLSGQTVNESKKSLKEKASMAFEELYEADGKTESLQEFRSKWGSDAENLENIFNGFKDKIVSSREQIIGGAASIGRKDGILISVKAAKAWPKLSSDQRDHLLTIVGYSRKELVDISKKIGISAGLNTGLYWGYESVGVIAGGIGATHPFLGDFSDNGLRVTTAIVLSYLTYWSMLAINAQQNLRLLRNESINISPSAIATGAFFLLKKIQPNNEKIQNWGTRAGSLSIDVILEILWATTLVVPGLGPSFLVSANLAGAGLNGLQAAVDEGILRYKNQKKKDS